MKNAPFPYDVTCVIDGREYKGSYVIALKMVKVTSSYGTKSTQVGGSNAEITALRLFQNILTNAKGKGLLRD